MQRVCLLEPLMPRDRRQSPLRHRQIEDRPVDGRRWFVQVCLTGTRTRALQI